MWDKVGMARNEEGLKWAISEIQKIRDEFYTDVRIPGSVDEFNPELDKANRVSDFLELGELMAIDALTRTESCGGHFREESQTEEGEAKRNDKEFAFVSAWEYTGNASEPKLHKEELVYENIKLVERNYK
jgi:succinate dehydrogenase / fumarate reductase, flavoprotein subunit